MTAHRSAALALVLAVVLAPATGCGTTQPPAAAPSTAPMSAGSTADVSTSDVTTVAWPSSTTDIQALAARLPRRIAGLESDGSFQMDDSFPVIMTYGQGEIGYDGPSASPVIQVAVMNTVPGGPDTSTLPAEMVSPGGMLMAIFGLTQGCAPDTVAGDPPMGSQEWFSSTARTVWFTCEVGMVQNHGELTGAQRRHLAGWAGPGTAAYLVDAPSRSARDEAVAALIGAARAT